MSLFEDENHIQNQVEVYEEALEAAENKLMELDGVNTPEAGAQREQLSSQIAEIQLNIEQLNHAQQQANEQEQGGDMFND